MIPQSTKNAIILRCIEKFGRVQCEGEYRREGYGDNVKAIRLGNCLHPECHIYDYSHIVHRHMGGTKRAWVNEPENILLLCRFDHDLFDGRARR
jgi:hypothetical protein